MGFYKIIKEENDQGEEEEDKKEGEDKEDKGKPEEPKEEKENKQPPTTLKPSKLGGTKLSPSLFISKSTRKRSLMPSVFLLALATKVI